jgi:type VI secretion system secreted protein Hcp
MATNMFLVLDGIPGESQDSQFLKSVEISSLSYGMSVPGSPTDPVGGKVSVDQIVVSKRVDLASLPLLQALAEARPVGTGRISIRRAGPVPPPPPFLVIDLRGVLVRGVEVQNNSGDEVPSERVTLAFESIVWTYTPVKGTPMTYDYRVVPMA